MPDPKGLFEAITRDLEAVGFKIVPNTETWRRTTSTDESAGKYPMWLLGWTCDWAGADNFLKTAFFGYVDGKPSTEFAYKNDELEKTMNDALAATDEATAQAALGEGAGPAPTDMPTVPLVNSTPPAAAADLRQGLRRERCPQRVPQHRLARQVARRVGGPGSPRAASDPA